MALPVTIKSAKPITEATLSEPSSSTSNQGQTILGRSIVLRGELSGTEDLVIEGQFDGNISAQDNSLTVGPQGHVKAEVRARRVVIHGSVSGNISAREKIEIRKSGHVEGDLMAASIAIEDGAYFKGGIEILREDAPEVARAASVSSTLEPETKARAKFAAE